MMTTGSRTVAASLYSHQMTSPRKQSRNWTDSSSKDNNFESKRIYSSFILHPLLVRVKISLKKIELTVSKKMLPTNIVNLSIPIRKHNHLQKKGNLRFLTLQSSRIYGILLKTIWKSGF